MSTKTFVNLPVKDVAKATEFFTALGFSFNEQFSDENTKCMVISDDAYAMLHVERSSRPSFSRTLRTQPRAGR